MSGSNHKIYLPGPRAAAPPALPQGRAYRPILDDEKDVESPYSDASEEYVYPQEDHIESYLRQNLECAKVALEYYNKKNHTNYELVEAMDSCGFDCAPTWIHCNFMAKKKTTTDQDADSTTKLFFAELHSKSCHWVVTACCIFKGKSCSCEYCENDAIKHPTHGFRMRRKHWLNQPYALRSQSRPRRLI